MLMPHHITSCTRPLISLSIDSFFCGALARCVSRKNCMMCLLKSTCTMCPSKKNRKAKFKEKCWSHQMPQLSIDVCFRCMPNSLASSNCDCDWIKILEEEIRDSGFVLRVCLVSGFFLTSRHESLFGRLSHMWGPDSYMLTVHWRLKGFMNTSLMPFLPLCRALLALCIH
jgi:hypothetical protein